MQPICEGHPQVRGQSQGLRLLLHPPTVLEEPVLQGDSDADAHGSSIYGSVLCDGGLFRMWYQAWPRDWSGTDAATVACVESDDGLHWRRPDYGLVECCGSKQNPLTDLPFHCPSVLVDPHAASSARFRAFGYADPGRLNGQFPHQIDSRGYFTAHSADGVCWQLDSSTPLWSGADVITSVWDSHADCARIALKRNGQAAGQYRRRFFSATWSRGEASEPISAFIPDEYDDLNARTRGFHSADYYGVGLMPTPGPSIGFLWNFRHLPPLGHHEPHMWHYGSIGSVDLSIVYQLERGGRWLHVSGRPDWLRAADAPEWARGALYTAASPIDVGDETWLYFTGTPGQHGWCGHNVDIGEFRRSLLDRGGSSRIGLMKWPRNRIIGFQATHPERLQLSLRIEEGAVSRLILNAVTRPGGHVRVALLDAELEPLPGYGFDDCEPIAGDQLEAVVRWQGQSTLPDVRESQSLIAEIEITDGTLYAFDFVVSQ